MLLCTAVHAQTTYVLNPGKTSSFFAPFNFITVNDIYIRNADKTAPLSITWELVSVNVPSGWDYSMCDLGNCHVGIPAGPTVMGTAPAGDSAFLGLNVDPMNIAGYGEVKVRIYVTGQSPSGADTLTWQITAGPTGVQQQFSESLVSVFPNPFSGTITVNVPAGEKASAQIFDGSGKCHAIMTLSTGMPNRIDLKALASGVYYVNISCDGKRLFKRIVKE